MKRREVPKLNKENFLAWKSLMRLHIVGIGDGEIHYLDNEYVDIPSSMIGQQMKEKHEHN